MALTVSVLGLGRMGSALAGALLTGHRLTVWNRTPDKARALSERGARVAESVLDAVRASDVTLVNVHDYDASDGFLRQPAVQEALRGKLLIQATSGSPQQARDAERWARANGIDYLDAAIMGPPELVAQEELTILYSGPQANFERARSLTRALGGRAEYVGENVGHASALDAALLTGMWGRAFGVLQGALYCQAEEIPLETYQRFHSAVAPVSESVADDVLVRIREQRFGPDVPTPASIDTHYLALRCALALCRAHGLDDSLPAAFAALFDKSVQRGLGERDFAEILSVMRAK